MELQWGDVEKSCNRKTTKDLWWDDASVTTLHKKRVLASESENRVSSRINWKLGLLEPVRVDVLQMSLMRQAHLERELRSKEVQLTSAKETIEKLSREMGSLAVAHDSAVDAVQRARTVLECVLSGR